MELWSTAAGAHLAGDLPTYARLARHGEDYTLTPPNGGPSRRDFDGFAEAVRATAERFRDGDCTVEAFRTYASGAQHATVAALPRQEWTLRLTLAFRSVSRPVASGPPRGPTR